MHQPSLVPQWGCDFVVRTRVKLQLTSLFSYFYPKISKKILQLIDGQLSIGFCDFPRDLRDRWLTLPYLNLSAIRLPPTFVVLEYYLFVKTAIFHQMYVSCIKKIFIRKQFKIAPINMIEIGLLPYLFLL